MAVFVAVGVLVLLAVAGTVVVRSLGPGGLDADQVERDVAAQFEEREGVAIDVTCPEDMPKESGGVFSCDGTTSFGVRRAIEIQVADPEDDVDYHWADFPR